MEDFILPDHIQSIQGGYFNSQNRRWVHKDSIKQRCDEYWAKNKSEAAVSSGDGSVYIRPNFVPEVVEAIVKRKAGRQKGSKNKKTIIDPVELQNRADLIKRAQKAVELCGDFITKNTKKQTFMLDNSEDLEHVKVIDERIASKIVAAEPIVIVEPVKMEVVPEAVVNDALIKSSPQSDLYKYLLEEQQFLEYKLNALKAFKAQYFF